MPQAALNKHKSARQQKLTLMRTEQLRTNLDMHSTAIHPQLISNAQVNKETSRKRQCQVSGPTVKQCERVRSLHMIVFAQVSHPGAVGALRARIMKAT
eukprot:4253930-Amphidinium_carterae.1